MEHKNNMEDEHECEERLGATPEKPQQEANAADLNDDKVRD